MAKKKVLWNARQLRLDLAQRLGRIVTLEEVAKETGIRAETLSRIENNEFNGVKFTTLERLAEFYQLDSVAPLLKIEDQRRGPSLTPVPA